MPRLQPRLEAIVNLLAAHPGGLSSDFLQGALNLQRHSLRASLTFIRRAGVDIETRRQNGQTFYRLSSSLQTAEHQNTSLNDDTLFAGIAPDVALFYRNRALVLNAERE